MKLDPFTEKSCKVTWQRGVWHWRHFWHQEATAFHLSVGGASSRHYVPFEPGPCIQCHLKLPTEDLLAPKGISEHEDFTEDFYRGEEEESLMQDKLPTYPSSRSLSYVTSLFC